MKMPNVFNGVTDVSSKLDDLALFFARLLSGSRIGLGLFGRDHYGTQDFGGHVQLVLTTALQIHPISHAFAGFRLQHFSDAGIYGSHSLGVDLYIIEVGYRF